MKKVLSLITLLGALASTAAAAPYYMTQPAGGALTPYDWQPVYSVDAIYNWSTNHAPDTAGARLNFSLYSNANSTVRHQFTISGGYEAGSRNYSLHYITADNYSVDLNRYNIQLEKLPVTLGYDINLAISDSVMFDFGVKGGYTFGFLTTKVKNGSIEGYSLKGLKETYNTGGFTYGATAGLKVQFSDAIYARIAYEFTRTFFTEDLPSHINISQHGIVLGVGCTF